MALLLDSDTSELLFKFEEKRQLSSSIKLRNPTENHVAFKILCTRPRWYGVQPWIGVLSPGGSCDVTVKTQAPRRSPTIMQTGQSRDIFKILSVIARPGTTKEDARNLFNTAVAHMIEESRLRVVYTSPQAQVAALDVHNFTKSSLATTSQVTNSVIENQRDDLQVDESRSIAKASASHVVHISDFDEVDGGGDDENGYEIGVRVDRRLGSEDSHMCNYVPRVQVQREATYVVTCTGLGSSCGPNKLEDEIDSNANKLKDKMVNFSLLVFSSICLVCVVDIRYLLKSSALAWT